MSVSHTRPAAPADSALEVYLANTDLFLKALRMVRLPSTEDRLDVLHTFLLERLPAALTAYNPQIGELRPWLFTVFLNYLRWQSIAIARASERWVDVAVLDRIGTEPTQEDLSPQLLSAVQSARQQLGRETRTALLLYFGDGPEAGSIRAVARAQRWTNHSTRVYIVEGLAHLASIVRSDLLSEEERVVCRLRLSEQTPWSEVAARIGCTETQARSLFRSAVTKLGRTLGFSEAPADEANMRESLSRPRPSQKAG